MKFYDLLMHHDQHYNELVLDLFKTNDIYLNEKEIDDIIVNIMSKKYKGELFLKLCKMLESYIDVFLPKYLSPKNRKCLDLKNLNLDYIPIIFLKSINFSQFHFSGNNINFLPNTLLESNAIVPITELLLDNCNFTEVPSIIIKLTKLETLSMKNNNITTIPEWLNILPCLKKVNVNIINQKSEMTYNNYNV